MRSEPARSTRYSMPRDRAPDSADSPNRWGLTTQGWRAVKGESREESRGE